MPKLFSLIVLSFVSSVVFAEATVKPKYFEIEDGGYFPLVSPDGTRVYVMNRNHGAGACELTVIDMEKSATKVHPGNEWNGYCATDVLRMSPNSKLFAYSYEYHGPYGGMVVKLHDAFSAIQVAKYHFKHGEGEFGQQNALSFSPDSKKIAIAPAGYPEGGQIIEIGSGKSIPLDLNGLEGNSTTVVRFSPDGSLLVVGSNDKVRLFDANNGQTLWTKRFGQIGSKTTFQFYRNGSRLLVEDHAKFSPRCIVFDIKDGDTFQSPCALDEYERGFFSSNEERYLVPKWHKMEIWDYDARDGEQSEMKTIYLGDDLAECQDLPFYRCELGTLYGGAVSPKRDRTYQIVWVPKQGSQTEMYAILVVFDLATGNTIAKLDTLGKELGTRLELSNDGSKLTVRTKSGILFYDLNGL